jgi:hypothetical protein
MVDFDQVQRLRDYAKKISYEEAKKILEEVEGDMLEAVIRLEKENKIERPEAAGYYNSKADTHSEEGRSRSRNHKGTRDKGRSFGELVGTFLRWCGRMIHKGNINHFEVVKDDGCIITLPVTVLVLLLLFAFWVIIPLLILGLFFGYRYRFSGPDLDQTEVNEAMEKVSQATVRAVDSVVNAVENIAKDEDKDESDGAHSDY